MISPLSVVIPALDAAAALPSCLASLTEGRHGGLVGEILVVDGGSRDGTVRLAEAGGARAISAPRGRGVQLAAGGAAAVGEWLLFLHADTRLAAGWSAVVAAFIGDEDKRNRAGYFRLRFDASGTAPRLVERLVELRCRWLGLPYGDQGLLIRRSLYDAIGGFRTLPLMEDVELVRRLGRRRVTPLAAVAVTSAERYRKSGYLRRSLRNLLCLSLYGLGVPPRLILRIYV